MKGKRRRHDPEFKARVALEAIKGSTEVVFDGDRPARIEGLLTLRGVTRPVTLTVTSFKRIYHPLAKKDAIGANATGSLKRSEFGAGKFVPLVGDEVTLSIALEAIKQ